MTELAEIAPDDGLGAVATSYPAPRPRPVAAPAPARHGVRTVLLWELEKLTAQLRTRLALLVCLLGPFTFVLAVKLTGTVPADTLFGRWVLDSGFAVPLVVLGFAAAWGFPILTCLIAGDIFSAEDHLGTWKTVLTRSRSRGAFYVGKVFAAGVYIAVALLVLTASSLCAGVLLEGHRALIGLSGNVIAPGRALELVLVAWLSALLPALAFGAIGVLISVASRNSLAGIVGPTIIGLLMQFAQLVDGVEPVRRLLLGTALTGWHGLFTAQPYHRPLVEGALLSAAYLVVCLTGAWLLLRRRDITEG